ncbi:hypothetical protein OCL06_13920 [Alteromonas sp. ASW11-19]|uniref:Uncharacterized protein n=1 Tax=Alteromonas salexigens TaxID=2982530 RepID=A0ABT2VV05_9ALTE|nr:hypothetical protein [Alteromonas salexigens]MCU7555689.1 hypothetical protein [Alteromonas salexigens]
MNRLVVIAVSGILVGCQSAPAVLGDEKLLTQPVETEYRVNAPIAFFSTFPSEAASEACLEASDTGTPCVDDLVSPQAFLSTLTASDWFSEVLPSATAADYELLVANQTATMQIASPWQQFLHNSSLGYVELPTQLRSFTELTVQWRGVEIDSRIVNLDVNALDASTEHHSANTILSQWWLEVSEARVFSARFLFSALKASDYFTQMTLPQSIGEFVRQDTQLYHDPFKGVISRYLHPQYDSAMLDVTVYPILAANFQTPPAALDAELEQDKLQAQAVTLDKGMTLDDHGGIQPIVIPGAQTMEEGRVLQLAASADREETLFASTYVFRQQDKIVKFTTTFPRHVADPLIAKALPEIIVPGPSRLMTEIRRLQTRQPSTQNQ